MEQTTSEAIKQTEDNLRYLDELYEAGDSFATHLNVAERIHYLLERLDFLKNMN
jgi:hypothetical protein